MIEKLKEYFKNIEKKFKNRKFKKEVSKVKEKLYIFWENNKSKSFKSSRNKFKIFKTKLEFENTFNEIKKLHLYYYIIWAILILSTSYVVVFSHYFSLKSVDIIRNDEFINIDLAYRSIENIRLKPMIFIKKSDIRNSIVSHQPNIKEIIIRKIYPSNIKITLTSYKELYNVNIDWKYYKITQNWVFIPSKEEEKTNLIKISWLDNFWIIDYKKVLNEDYINKIKQIEELIKARESFINVKEIKYYKKEREAHFMDEKWTVYIFDLTKEANVQVEKLNIFYKEYLKKIKFWIVYVDLRVNERVIYCSTEREFQCRENLKSIYLN